MTEASQEKAYTAVSRPRSRERSELQSQRKRETAIQREMGKGWRRMMLFGREREREREGDTKAPSENGGASSVTSTPRNLNRASKEQIPLKLSLFSAFRTTHKKQTTTIIATSCSAIEAEPNSGSASTPPSLHCRIDRGAKPETGIRTDAWEESDKGEVLVGWEAPSPAPKWRSHTPPPLSKLKKSFYSLFQTTSSTPSSPKSPSPFSLFKSTILSTRIKCEKCGENMKRVQGTREGEKRCPVCSPLTTQFSKQLMPREVPVQKPAVNYKAYNDDEPLSLSVIPTARSPCRMQLGNTTPPSTFNPIPEANEEELDYNSDSNTCQESEVDDNCRKEDLVERHQRQNIVSATSTSNGQRSNISISVMPEAALVSSGRRHMSYVVAVRVKAPLASSAPEAASRAPMDLVAVLEISPEMTADKLQTLKQTIRPIIASMGPADRFSIVAFSGSMTKRLMPLSRMTKQGQRTARQIVDRLVVCSATQQGRTMMSSASDALRKAKRVLEDRRECNPVATIMLLSDKHLEQQQSNKHQNAPQHDATKFVHLEFPSEKKEETKEEEEKEDALMKCVTGLVSVVMRDVTLQFILPSGEGEVTAVYRYSLIGSGTSSSGTGGTGSSISLGDLHAGQEVELLLELRVPLNQSRHSPSFCVKCTYRDPVTLVVSRGVEQPPLLLPPIPVQNSSLRLRNLFVTFRSVVESRRLVGLNDFATALHLLYSARSLLLQCPPSTAQDLIPNIEAELVEIQRRRGIQNHIRQQVTPVTSPGGCREPLTPTSAWRAAEQLAKVAIMRKSQNRVSDLHGFENARF